MPAAIQVYVVLKLIFALLRSWYVLMANWTHKAIFVPLPYLFLHSSIIIGLIACFIVLYSSWDQTVHFAYVSSLWVEGKQMHILCKTKALPETVSDKVLPLGNNVYSLDSI
jgi:hypothetical protein